MIRAAAWFYRRPQLELTDLTLHHATTTIRAAREPGHLDRASHPLNNLPRKAVVLGGYAPLGAGTFKRPKQTGL